MLFFLWSKMVFVGHWSFSELQKCFKLSLLLMRSLTIFGTVGIWSGSLWLVSQWKCWKSGIHCAVLNTKQYYYNVRLFWKEAKMKLGRTQKCDCDKYFQFSPILFTLLLPVVIAKTLVDTCDCHLVSRVREMLFLAHNLEPCQADAAAWPLP